MYLDKLPAARWMVELIAQEVFNDYWYQADTNDNLLWVDVHYIFVYFLSIWDRHKIYLIYDSTSPQQWL